MLVVRQPSGRLGRDRHPVEARLAPEPKARSPYGPGAQDRNRRNRIGWLNPVHGHFSVASDRLPDCAHVEGALPVGLGTAIRLIGYQPSLDQMFSAWRTIERTGFT